MVNFVIWGAGLRGKRILKLLKNKVVAFIDGKKQSVDKIDGVSVINFEEYLEDYFPCPIIVSPLFSSEILQNLTLYPDIPVISMSDEPFEISMGFEIPFDRMRLNRFEKDASLYIYGINIFAILLAEYLNNHGWNSVKFIPSKEGINRIQACGLGLEVVEQLGDEDVIFCVQKDIEKVGEIYPANRIEDFWNITKQVESFEHKELEKFRNIHASDERRLFIVATGPSLTIKDLDLLHKKKELTMSVNMVYRCFAQTCWRPDYYLFEDMYGLKVYEKEVRSLGLSNMFLSDVGISDWDKGSLGENIYVYHLQEDRMHGWPRLSPEISKYISGGRTVLLSCLQMAFYMGFKEIYLIGADCDYKGNAQDEGNHFIDGYCSQEDSQPRHPFPVMEAFVGYQAARYYAEERGIKIYNATRGGRLEVFERVDFDSLFIENTDGDAKRGCKEK